MHTYFIGVEDHYAWANLVSVDASGHEPMLLDSRRVTLLDRGLPAAPFHHDSTRLPRQEAEQLILDVTTSANDHAAFALSSLLADLAPRRCRGLAIRAPPLSCLPATAAEAHADAGVMNRADGMIYHDALTRAAAKLDLSITYFEKDTVLARAALCRGTTAHDLERRLKALGTVHGPPWRKGHVLASAGAILAHGAAARH
jgi:hypothetical protein